MATTAIGPTVALVGRVNVGKSSLFNRLTEARTALVSPIPATTRDRKMGLVNWRGVQFTLIDTGGVEAPSVTPQRHIEDDLIEKITAQTEHAINEAVITVLVVSAEDGILPQDRAWAKRLRARGKKNRTILVVNKVDNAQRATAVAEFERLGLGTPWAVSAANGRGTGDLLDAILESLTPGERPPMAEDTTRRLTIAILGQPNSGKSSLLNALLGEDRLITSPVAHTTREPQDIPCTLDGRELLLIDTAGIRRRAHVTAGVERAGVSGSLKTIDRSDVVLLLIDVARGPSRQDQRLAHQVIERGKGLVLIINKWDLVKDKTAASMTTAERNLRFQLPGLDWVPMIFTSATTKQRVREAVSAALGAVTATSTALTEEILTDFLRQVTHKTKPTRGKGVRHPKILSLKQVSTTPPRFELAVRGELHPSYLKYLENKLREHFGFGGAPISIDLKAKRKKIGTPKTGVLGQTGRGKQTNRSF